MRILLVRHAESEGNGDEAQYALKGDVNISITPKGCVQAVAAGDFLSSYYKNTQTKNWPHIYLSSYRRPQETFRGIYEQLKEQFPGTPRLKEDVRLIEKSFGGINFYEQAVHEGNICPRAVQAIQWLHEKTRLKDQFTVAYPFGESQLSTHSRVKDFIDGTLFHDVTNDAQQDDFLVVTHGAIIQAFVMAWFHLPMNSKATLGNPNNCNVLAIEKEGESWQARTLYDGQEMKALHDVNPISEIKHITVDTLPPLPHPVTK